MISSGPQLPSREAGAPSRSGAPTCDAPGSSERTAQAWRPVRRRWGRGLALGLAAHCLLPVGLDKGHFLGGAGNVPSMPRFVVHRDFLPPQQQRGAPTRTPGLEERTLSGCSSSGPMADPRRLVESRSCRRVLPAHACCPVRSVRAAFSLEVKFVICSV